MSSEQTNESEPLPLKQVDWRLAVMMAERQIRSATELHRRLAPHGIDISSDRISRIVAKMPDRLNMEVLVGLMTVLDCSASDLIREIPDASKSAHTHTLGSTPEKPETRPPRKAKSPARARDASAQHELDSTVASMVGTKVEPIPIKPRDKR